jgi:hypothetical protein
MKRSVSITKGYRPYGFSSFVLIPGAMFYSTSVCQKMPPHFPFRRREMRGSCVPTPLQAAGLPILLPRTAQLQELGGSLDLGPGMPRKPPSGYRTLPHIRTYYCTAGYSRLYCSDACCTTVGLHLTRNRAVQALRRPRQHSSLCV